jgi:hypothetical protein
VCKGQDLLDHLVRTHKQRSRNSETERLGGFEIDYQFVLSGILHRHLGRLGAFENAIDVNGCLPVLLGGIVPIGCQPTFDDEVAEIVKSGQAMPSREFNDLTAMRVGDPARQHN